MDINIRISADSALVNALSDIAGALAAVSIANQGKDGHLPPKTTPAPKVEAKAPAKEAPKAEPKKEAPKADAAKQAAADKASEERHRRFLLGKKAARDIKMDNGIVIVEAGQDITEEVLQKAKLANKFIELSMNVQ